MNVFTPLTIAIGAFLLFAIQPMVAKVVLPYYGGSSAVWTACLLFYQSFLLLGYSYAFALSKIKSIKRQAQIHGVLLLLSLLFIPIYKQGLAVSWLPSHPFLDIFVTLLVSIGLPYFLLSTTAPLVQYWLSRSSQQNDVYRLYSLSNVAAFAALFSYPLLFEFNLTLNQQLFSWSMGFIVFVLVALAVAFKMHGTEILKTKATAKELNEENKTPSLATLASWLLLSATGVILLIATTKIMTINVPPIPFLWILPLAAYLLTYILVFYDQRVYQIWYFRTVFVFVAIIGTFMFYIGTQFGIVTQVILYLLLLLAGCFICHGELARTKPGNQHLTLFYLVLAAGGCIGSLFVAFGATALFTQYYEFIVGIALVFVAIALTDNRDPNLAKAALIKRNGLTVVGFVLFAGLFVFLQGQYNRFNVFEARNFYGTVAVKDVTTSTGTNRLLIDGYTSHGIQALSKASSKPMPKSYYRLETGIGLTLSRLASQSEARVGIIGLGVGALAFYGKANDHYRFYEINPEVETVATKYFDYLSTANSSIKVTMGDARLTLASQEPESNQFDVLVVDAFSSDAIPTHLVTLEAVKLYLSHMAKDGVLAFHVSNSYLDLKPVLHGVAEQLGLEAVYFKTEASVYDAHQVEWVMLTKSADYLNSLIVKSQGQALKSVVATPVIWTDDYSSLLPILK